MPVYHLYFHRVQAPTTRPMRSAAQSRRTPPLKSISPIEKPKSRKFRQAPSPSSLRLFTPAAFRHRWQKNSRVPICRVSRSSPLPCTADAPMKTLLSNSTICAKKQKLRFWPAPRRLLRMFLCLIWSAAVPTKTTSLKSATSDAASAKIRRRRRIACCRSRQSSLPPGLQSRFCA